MGLITSYDDIKYGKIRNKWVVLALIYAFVVYSGLIIYFSVTVGINSNYLIGLLTNFLFSVMVGFGLWYFGIWTAGDGKLFLTYSFLLPLAVYSSGYVKYFPSFVLLINTFVPLFIFIFLKVLFQTDLEQKKESLKLIFVPKRLFSALISLFAVFWIIQIIFSLIKISNYFLSVIISISIFISLQKTFKKNMLKIAIIIAILRLVIDKNVYSLIFLRQFLFLFGFWILLRGFVLDLCHKLFAKEVKISELKRGMVSAELVYKKGRLFKKEVADLFSFFKNENHQLFDIVQEGLKEGDIKRLKKSNLKTLKIEQTLPFAPFLFMGVVITILANGNVFILLKTIIINLLEAIL